MDSIQYRSLCHDIYNRAYIFMNKLKAESGKEGDVRKLNKIMKDIESMIKNLDK